MGIREALDRGIMAGYPVVDVKVRLWDGSYHDVDSNEMAFKIAGSMAFQEAAKKAHPVLLEPIMKVEVVTPDDYTGAVTGDISSRRGQLEGQISRGGTQIITAMVPLSNMFGYSTDLRSRTQGRATYTMHFEKYAEAPRNVSEEVVAKVMGGKVARTRSGTGIRRSDGQGEVRPVEAAREHRDDRARGPREDVVDGGDHEGAGGVEPEGDVQGVRPDRQRARKSGSAG